MKKVMILILMGSLWFVPAALADQGSGCGLGKLILDGSSGTGAHIGAAILNDLIVPSTSAMTTGTSGCDTSKGVLLEKEQEEFVAKNFEPLTQEMAQGQGQYLDSLASLMGCQAPVYPDFANMTQARYEILFTDGEVNSNQLLIGLKREMAADPTLSSNCTKIS